MEEERWGFREGLEYRGDCRALHIAPAAAMLPLRLTCKITWPMSQLFEARPGAVWSLQVPERISKRQHSVVSSSAQPQVLPFTSSWLIQSSIMFRAYLRCSWKSKQSFGQKKGKLFCRWCHFSLSSPSFCRCCRSLWWREKAQRTHLICCQSEDGNALICSHSTSNSGDVSWILSQALQLRPVTREHLSPADSAGAQGQ